MGTRCQGDVHLRGIQSVSFIARRLRHSFADLDQWQEKQYPFVRDQYGVWRVTIAPLPNGSAAIEHGQAIKVGALHGVFPLISRSLFQLLLQTADGQLVTRVCPWSRYVQRDEKSNIYHTVFYNPPRDEQYQFNFSQPKKRDRLKIYEAHVGISSSEATIATYENFRLNVLPRIVKQGLHVA